MTWYHYYLMYPGHARMYKRITATHPGRLRIWQSHVRTFNIFCTKKIFGRVSASTLSPIWLFLVGVGPRWCQNRALLESTHAACSAFSTKDRRRTGELGVFARFRKKANDAYLGIGVPRGASVANVVSPTGHHIDHHMETTMTPHWHNILAPHLAM